MASTFCRACKLTSRRITASPWRVYATSRGLRTTAVNCEAHNFTMPALSPTMTEGTISSWKVKEGDTFTAGDVLLEIETDKAQMDVEAQDDGVVAKIMVQSGKSPIQVGARIAVLADPGDDIKSLGIPADESAAPPNDEKKISKNISPKSDQSTSQKPPKKDDQVPKVATQKQPPQGHELSGELEFIPSPGIIQLLHLHGLQMSEVNGTGPKGRVLKGDVLAYVGKIDKGRPEALAKEIAIKSKLDLSNIKKAAPPSKQKDAAKAKAAEKPVAALPEVMELAIPISMKNVSKVQNKLQRSFNTEMTWYSFYSRAVHLANQNLPPSHIPQALNPDDIFDELIGQVPKMSAVDGPYLVPEFREPLPAVDDYAPANEDIIDILTGAAPLRSQATNMFADVQSISEASNPEQVFTFSVTVPSADESRGINFLNNLKVALEETPETLINVDAPVDIL